MAEQYGVYASFRLPSGELVSSNRETIAELEKDIDLMFGEGASKKLWSKLNGGVANVSSEPVPSSSEPIVGVDSGSNRSDSPDPVPAQASVNPGLSDIPSEGFEPCEKCGALKDQWKAPGVSAKGKPYAGFFGCPNWKSH